MHGLRLLLSVALIATASWLNAQSGLTPPGDFLPHQPGEQFTPHHLLYDYFVKLTGEARKTSKLVPYGHTNEGRPLAVAIFSSPQNMARLDDIQENNLRLAGLEKGPSTTDNPIAIVWLTMSVHGNEPSGSECSMELAWKLASQTEPEIKKWLENTIVIVDPSANPDGYDRYTHWYRMVSHMNAPVQTSSREHREPWPGGRTNHYYFDLNRDWAWATQIESRLRLKLFQDWLPHIHADLHEQYIDNPYYFAPAAEPMHRYITPWQRNFQTEIGKNHAAYFDKNGWLYFTREVFDLFYPSYGDTYPMFNGSIGMTYEQAGHSSAGRAVVTSSGDTLTLRDRIDHHLTTSLSTIEMASESAADVVRNFQDFYLKSRRSEQGTFKSFVIPHEGNDPNKVNQLTELLDLHRIQYGLLGKDAGSVKAFDYQTGKDVSTSFSKKDLVISAYQPHSVMVQVLFEPEPELSDSLTYDITAWSLPHAFGLTAYGLKQRMEPATEASPYVAPKHPVSTRPYAWCVHRKGLAEARFLTRLLQQDVRVRYAARSFDLADQKFKSGALIITRGDNHRIQNELDSLVMAVAALTNVEAFPIFSGFASNGPDLGSESFKLMKKPQVAVVYGPGVDDNAFGHSWFFFEQELGMPFVSLSTDQLAGFHLDDFNTLVLPHGYYKLSEDAYKNIKDWVRRGGRLIAFENAVRAFAGKDGFNLNVKSANASASEKNTPTMYQSRKRSIISEQLPGAVIRTRVDTSHPITTGLDSYYFSLKTQPSAYELPERGHTPVWIGEDYLSFGFIGSKVKPRLENSPVVSIERKGKGELVYFIDNPLFRSFWNQGKVLFANAIFY